MSDKNSQLLIILLLAIGSLLVSACTTDAIYRNVQRNQQQECRMLPAPQQAHCLSLYDVPYEQYEKQRETLEAAPK